MRFVALLAWLWPLLTCAAAWAEASPSTPATTIVAPDEAAPFASALRVEVISCMLEESAVDVSEMLAIARAELAPHVLVRAEERNSQPLLRVDACHDQRLVLRLLSPEGPEQSIALHDVPPEHRPRVAALALAELVLTARTVGAWRAERAAKAEEELAHPPSFSQGATSARLPDWNPPPAPPAPPVPPGPKPHSARLGLGTEARLFIQSLSLSFGPRFFLRLPRLDLTLVSLIGRRQVDLGELRTGLVAINVGVHLWRSRGALDAAFSLGTELGVTWGRAQPNSSVYGDTTRAQAQFASAFAQLTLGGAISDGTYAHGGLAAGYAVGVHAQVDDEHQVGTMGAFVGLSAGLAWLL